MPRTQPSQTRVRNEYVNRLLAARHAHAYSLEPDGSPLGQSRSEARASYIIENFDKHLDMPERRDGYATLFYTARAGNPDPWKYYAVVPTSPWSARKHTEVIVELDSAQAMSSAGGGARYLVDQTNAVHGRLRTKFLTCMVVYPARDTQAFNDRRAEIHFIRRLYEAAPAA